MATIVFGVGGAKVADAMQIFEHAGGNVDELLIDLGELAVSKAKLGFRKQTDPYGNKWAPLKESTIRARNRRRGVKGTGGTHQILRDRGLLNRSINYATGSRHVDVGAGEYSDAILARHLFGSVDKSTPARPFLPTQPDLPKSWEASILKLMRRHMQKALGDKP